MAKAQKAEKAEAAKNPEALKKRIEAILHSNGFDGSKAAGEIVTAVAEYTGEDFSDAPAKKEEKTEE